MGKKPKKRERLADSTVKKIRRMVERGVSTHEIEESTGVPYWTIDRIRYRKCYAKVGIG